MSYQTEAVKDATIQKINLIEFHLAGHAQTALDVGCNEGVLSLHLEHLGLDVTSIEANPAFVKRGNEFIASNFGTTRIQNARLTLEDVEGGSGYDVVLFLSVYHQLVANVSIDYANNFFKALVRKAGMQLFFQPCCIHKKHGYMMPFVENDIRSIYDYFYMLAKQAVPSIKCTLIGVTENNLPIEESIRPLMLFEKGSLSMNDDKKPSRNSKIARIDIDKAVTVKDLQRFDIVNGWHHKVSACREIIMALESKSQNLIIEELEYHRYMTSFRPSKFGDVWDTAFSNHALRNVDIGFMRSMPLDRYCSWFPWYAQQDSLENMSAGISEKPVIPQWDMTSFYRSDIKSISEELVRFNNLIMAFRKDGYRPELNQDGYVRGYIIQFEDDYRFAVVAGQHRLAVMAALGYKQIPVKLTRKSVNVDDVASWNLVKNGIYTKEQALNFCSGIYAADGFGVAGVSAMLG